MSCVGLLAIAAGAPQCSPPSTDECPEDDLSLAHYVQPSSTKMTGAPMMMMEAALKVDKVLARLQSLQGTVTIPTPPVSATVSACISPAYSRSKSCIGSPKFEREEKENVIRIHDILRFSDDFTGKFPSLTQEHRGRYLRRLSRSKTEVFDEKKDPRDPHGEWKHWSSPAGDVHKVISEILMASQIAKEITSMVNACLVHTDVGSSDEEKPVRKQVKHKHKQKASSSNKESVAGSSNRALKKEDPMHKFRVVTPSDTSKRRPNSGNRKEILYPKSKLTADLVRPVDDTQELSSTERKMQSRRSPRASVSPRTSLEEPVQKSRSKAAASAANAVESPRVYLQEPVLKTQVRVAGESSRVATTPRASVEEPVLRNHARLAAESSSSRAAPGASCRASSSVEEPASRNHARVAAESARTVGTTTATTARARLEEPFLRNHARIAATGTTTPCSSVGEPPYLRNNIRVSATANAAESSRASGTPRASGNDPVLTRIRTRVAAPEASSTLVAPAPTPRTSSVEDPILTRIRIRVAAAAEPSGGSASLLHSAEEPLSKLRTRASAAAPTPTKSASTSDMWEAKEITNCFSSPRAMGESKKSALPSSSAVRKGRNSRSPPQASHTSEQPRLSTSSLAPLQTCSPRRHNSLRFSSPADYSLPEQPSTEQRLLVNSPVRSRIGRLPQENAAVAEGSSARIRRSQRESAAANMEPRIASSSASSLLPTAVRKAFRAETAGGAEDLRIPGITAELPNCTRHQRPSASARAGGDNVSTTSSGSLKGGRDDDWFRKSLEATEISLGPNKPWKSGTKAVLFSNPTFAPASPPGARPAQEKEKEKERPATPPVRQPSPNRSTSATRRVKEWVGNVLHGRRSVSPDIAGRVGHSNRKLISLSPGRASLPSLISRLPSRGKKASSSAPRATVFPSVASKDVVVGELPLPPCRQAQKLAASKLAELPSHPGGGQVMELKAQKEILDRQAHHMAAQKKLMVEDWSRTVEPPAPFDKDVGVACRPGPVLYSMRQLNDMDYSAKHCMKKAMESSSPMREKQSYVRYFREQPEPNLPLRKDREIANFKLGSGWENEVGVLGVLSQCRSMTQEQPTVPVAASKRVEKENVATAAAQPVVDSAQGALRKSWSMGSQRSTSTVRAMSTGKVRTGPSFLKRAKDWMRTQTPFRDRPQKTTDFS
ncbi:hypothetical protein MPTK1_3g01820 [Marchantia polymorpha subsp. ruderalis]|uniref:Uncharacterized protein n=2 Tax=Marchantia polymorpha TaxID=3197 RepID=A0AAF6AWF6_MARPO|nr:hypothetical protein MARPO_0007s0173 [Marchantia polymorpha]BBN04090.1 hypothetical protein Mp_3g01820 [Marchantia polymorpha subsp. ruderalis]|eukprot:PTQ47777.1 hypothetical protein MARPO_0007s0173 [Marchantia polymorpha]